MIHHMIIVDTIENFLLKIRHMVVHIGEMDQIQIDYGDDHEIVVVIIGDWIRYRIQQKIDNDHVHHDGMCQVYESGVKYWNIDV